jgi:hypothetical protein
MDDETKKNFIQYTLQTIALKPKLPTTLLIKRFREKCRMKNKYKVPNAYELDEIIKNDITPMVSLAIQNADALHEIVKKRIEVECQPTNFLEQKTEFMEKFLGEAMKLVQDGKFELAENKITLLEPLLSEIKGSKRYEVVKQTIDMLDDLIESKRQLQVKH